MRVQDTIAAVGSLAGKGELRAASIEFRTPPHELLDSSEPLFDEDPGGIRINQAVAGFEGIPEVQADFILIAEGGGNPALRVARVALAQLTFRDAQDPPVGRKIDAGAQPGDACPNDDEIDAAGTPHIKRRIAVWGRV